MPCAGDLPRLWLRVDLAPGVSLGPGKIELLRGIKESGSISAAGRRIGMSYKRAWQLVDALNTHFAAPLVSANRGGARGGGATLTALGESVLTTYEALQTASKTACSARLNELVAALNPDHSRGEGG
jgi:molybdate transport system regulatory protein